MENIIYKDEIMWDDDIKLDIKPDTDPFKMTFSEKLQFVKLTGATDVLKNEQPESLIIRQNEKIFDLPTGIKVRYLNLSGCGNLTHLPEDLIIAEEMSLDGCEKLKNIPTCFNERRSLTSMNINYCKSLEKLPNYIICNDFLSCINVNPDIIWPEKLLINRLFCSKRDLENIPIKRYEINQIILCDYEDGVNYAKAQYLGMKKIY